MCSSEMPRCTRSRLRFGPNASRSLMDGPSIARSSPDEDGPSFRVKTRAPGRWACPVLTRITISSSRQKPDCSRSRRLPPWRPRWHRRQELQPSTLQALQGPGKRRGIDDRVAHPQRIRGRRLVGVHVDAVERARRAPPAATRCSSAADRRRPRSTADFRCRQPRTSIVDDFVSVRRQHAAHLRDAGVVGPASIVRRTGASDDEHIAAIDGAGRFDVEQRAIAAGARRRPPPFPHAAKRRRAG